MAPPTNGEFGPLSPRSSGGGGGESLKGTPDTHVTPSSSCNNHEQLPMILPQALLRPSPVPSLASLGTENSPSFSSTLDKDPFVSPKREAVEKFPSASSRFGSYADFAPLIVSNNISGPVATVLSSDLGLSRHICISGDPRLSSSDVQATLKKSEHHRGPARGQRTFSSSANNQLLVHFTDIRDSCDARETLLLAGTGWTIEFVDDNEVHDQIANNHIGDSFNVPRFLGRHLPDISFPRINRSELILVRAVFQRGSAAQPHHAIDVARRFLRIYGELFAFLPHVTLSALTVSIIVEYCDSSAALAALSNCSNGIVVEAVHLSISVYEAIPTRPTSSLTHLTTVFRQLSTVDNQENVQRLQNYTSPSKRHDHVSGQSHLQHQALAPYMPYSSYGLYQCQPTIPHQSIHNAPTVGLLRDLGAALPAFATVGSIHHAPPSPAHTSTHYQCLPGSPDAGAHDSRRQNAARVNKSAFHNNAGHHNHVDIGRIRDGIDVRTTIMLRNIPNKVDQPMLKGILDESSWGKYDFMYLRIDFANDCNVGYAFINFVDPLDIIAFVEARGNQRWNCFKSDKVAEVSYATIQGKDCLVQKFRNSSVMLEASHYRPKLYFTSNGPAPDFAGEEEPFPDPDNQSKMKRSCENAEHVGLFTPNVGQHYRDEQRRRRSHFDRGTRLAALEEYDYDEANYQSCA